MGHKTQLFSHRDAKPVQKTGMFNKSGLRGQADAVDMQYKRSRNPEGVTHANSSQAIRTLQNNSPHNQFSGLNKEGKLN